jgi:hypothetical protein
MHDLNMQYKILSGMVAFVAGVIFASQAEIFFREQIQQIFVWASSGEIRFHGKMFYLFPDGFYYLSFGASFLLLTFSNLILQKRRLMLIHLVVYLLIFTVALVGVSSLNAISKVLECTICEGNVRPIHRNDINYGLLLEISVILATLPGIILLFRNNKAGISSWK